jgi:hypothetical protein
MDAIRAQGGSGAGAGKEATALARRIADDPQVRRAGQIGAFTMVAMIVYQFFMFGVVAPALFGVTRDVLDDPVRNMRSTSLHRPVVVAVYLAPLIVAFAFNALLRAFRVAHGRQAALSDAAWFAGAIGSVAGIIEASTVTVGIPTLAGWYGRDPSAAVAGMVTQEAISNGLHMVTFVGWGLAILLSSIAAWREATLSVPLAAYGVLAGLLGTAQLFTVEPVFLVLIAFIPWFAGVGWALRSSAASAMSAGRKR